MFKLFLPKLHVDSIYDISPEYLKQLDKKGIVVDLDNTLVPWNKDSATDEVINWLNEMISAGIHVTIFSNNNKDRVSYFADPLNVPYVSKANKPLKGSFNIAKQQMNIRANEMVVIGDQLLTDILGGNRSGCYTILVTPILQSDALITKFNRQIEKFILNYFYRTGKLTRRMRNG